MNNKYIPRLSEAAIPLDATWIKVAKKNSLVISVPEWKGIEEMSSEGYRYVWLYNRTEDAYLFCFRLEDGRDRGIAFQREHAGYLLQDEQTDDSFCFLITSHDLYAKDEPLSFLKLDNITLTKHPLANW